MGWIRARQDITDVPDLPGVFSNSTIGDNRKLSCLMGKPAATFEEQTEKAGAACQRPLRTTHKNESCLMTLSFYRCTLTLAGFTSCAPDSKTITPPATMKNHGIFLMGSWLAFWKFSTFWSMTVIT